VLAVRGSECGTLEGMATAKSFPSKTPVKSGNGNGNETAQARTPSGHGIINPGRTGPKPETVKVKREMASKAPTTSQPTVKAATTKAAAMKKGQR
jgi:hypothetical protein